MPSPPFASSPGLNPGEVFRRAAQHLGARRFAEAEALCHSLLRQIPDFPQAIHFLGLIAQGRGDLASAETQMRRSIALMPAEPSFHLNLGNILQQKGDIGGAEAMFRRALELNPKYFVALRNLALLMANSGRAREGAEKIRAFSRQNPGTPDIYIELGAALIRSGEYEDAVAAFNHAAALAPQSWRPYAEMARMLYRAGKPDLVLRPVASAKALGGPDEELNLLAAKALYDLDRSDESIAAADLVIARNPGNVEAHHIRALALRSLGRSAEAGSAFEAALAIDPGYMRSLTELVRLKRVAEGDNLWDRLRSIEKRLPGLDIENRVLAHFALGKAYEDLGELAASFEHVREANALHRARIVYDEAAVAATFGEIKRIWTSDFLRERQGHGNRSSVPVFIVGMPRSGSTLVEQIVASHPKAAGAGEVHYFRDAFLAVLGKRPKIVGLLEFLATISVQEISEISDLYLAALRTRFPEAERITDKLLGNCNSLGLIHAAFPNAAIIHCRRDPLDTCFSAYTQSFVEPHDYCYDLGELGRFYKNYYGLMEHWRFVLPAGAFLDVDYEALVTDFETQAKRIIAHCGLEWDPRCMEFKNNARPVRTASAAQVRQPLYKHSIGRADRFRQYLGPLADALGDLARR